MAQSAPPPPPRPQAPPHESETERRTRAVAEEEATRDKAEAALAHMAPPGQPPEGPLDPRALFPDEPTVLMNFPTPVTLTLSGEMAYTQVYFPAGVQAVPESLAADEYLTLSGATPVAAERR